MDKEQPDIHDEQSSDGENKDDLRESLNNRISYLCALAALIIAVVTFATTILGHDNMSFVILGLSLAIALLAIAAIQNLSRPKR